MEAIINQIIANRNYHMLSDEQVEAIKQLSKEIEELKIFKQMALYRIDVIEPRELILKSKVQEEINKIKLDIKYTKQKIKNNQAYSPNNNYLNEYQIVRLKAMNTKSLDIMKRLQKLIDERDEEIENGKK